MSASLRVGMNLLWLRPGLVGGSEVAAVATIEALHEFAGGELDLRLYAQPSFRDAHPDLARRVATTVVAVPGRSRPARVALESTWLSWMARRDRIDVAHFYGGVVPPGYREPNVLTLHDVQPLEPGSVFGATKKAWLTQMIPSSVARASAIAVPSTFVRDRVCALLDVDPAKVTVVPHGLDPLTDAERSALHTAATIRHRFGLPGAYVVFPAITYPHKNHEVLLRAFARVARQRGDLTLVLPGGAGSAEGAVSAQVERLGIGTRVRRVGRVSRPELCMLMREAAAMAFPSRYEGFGLPVLEAFSSDTPVIAAAAGSLPEVVGDAGRLVDPDDVDGWVDALEATIGGVDATPDASQRRRDQAAKFSWEHIASDLMRLYRGAAEGAGEVR